MSDFAELVRETLRGVRLLPSGPGLVDLDRWVGALDRRMRTVKL